MWHRVVEAVDDHIKPKTKQLALPVTIRQSSILKEVLEVRGGSLSLLESEEMIFRVRGDDIEDLLKTKHLSLSLSLSCVALVRVVDPWRMRLAPDRPSRRAKGGRSGGCLVFLMWAHQPRPVDQSGRNLCLFPPSQLFFLQILHDYFYAGGDGVKPAKLDSSVCIFLPSLCSDSALHERNAGVRGRPNLLEGSRRLPRVLGTNPQQPLIFAPVQEYQDLHKRLCEVFLPTDELISRFYELEEEAVCVVIS